MATRRLQRNTREAVLAGVAAGFADHFDLDPVLVRLAFIFLCFFGGSGIAIYLVAWVLMPRDVELANRPAGAAASGGSASTGDPSATSREDGGEGPEGRAGAPPGDRLARDAVEAGERVVNKVRGSMPDGPGRGRMFAGLLLILLGVLFLADRFLPFHWLWIGNLWPLVLVGIGVAMILGARRGG